MPPGFLGRLKLQPKLLPSFETQCHHCSSAWVGWGCCRTSCSNHRHGTRMPSIVEWAMLMEPQQYVPRKLEWGRRNASPASQCNLLPGDCSTCSKTTGSCGLVSGPQEKKISAVVISAFYHIASCLWCSMREKTPLLCIGRCSYQHGNRLVMPALPWTGAGSATGQPRLSASSGFCSTKCQQALETMATGQPHNPSYVAALIFQ